MHILLCSILFYCIFIFFFFQAEDGIRDIGVTGVQTCALPISGHPAAAFHRRSNVSASAASRSEKPCSACSTSTAATTSAGTLGRPSGEGNRSANIASGNSSRRCSAKNAYTLPEGNRPPSGDSASITPCWAGEVPCTTPSSRLIRPSTNPFFSSLLAVVTRSEEHTSELQSRQ